MEKIRVQKTNWQNIILPLMLFLVAINWHYFDFYRHQFQQIFKQLNLKPSLKTDLYNQTQAYHPYYALSLAANKYFQKPVFYLYSRYKPNDKIATDELEIKVNYYFYPRIIKPVYNKKKFLKKSFLPGSLIISDQKLKIDNLKWLNPHKNITQIQDYFFQQEKPYFLYRQL